MEKKKATPSTAQDSAMRDKELKQSTKKLSRLLRSCEAKKRRPRKKKEESDTNRQN